MYLVKQKKIIFKIRINWNSVICIIKCYSNKGNFRTMGQFDRDITHVYISK